MVKKSYWTQGGRTGATTFATSITATSSGDIGDAVRDASAAVWARPKVTAD